MVLRRLAFLLALFPAVAHSQNLVGDGVRLRPISAAPPACTAFGNKPCVYYNSVTGKFTAHKVDGTEVDMLAGSGTASALTAPAVHGTLSIGANLEGADANNNLWMQYQAAEAGATPWNVWAGQTANVSGPVLDQTVRMGFNLGPGGQLYVPGVVGQIGAIGVEFERFFVAAHPQMETHWVGVTPDGTQTRFLSAEVHLDDNTTALYIAATLGRLISGHNATDYAPVLWGAGGAELDAPSGGGQVFVDASQAWIHSGNQTGSNFARVTMFPDGEGYIQSKLQGGWSTTGAARQLLVDPSTTTLQSPDGTRSLVITNSLVTFSKAIVLTSDPGAALSGANGVTIRNNAGVLEASQNGGAYAAVGGGGGTVTADSPLTGNGSGGSHLACATCVVTGGSTMTGPFTFSGNQVGTYTLAGAPTLGASLAVGTTASFGIGNTTHVLTAVATAKLIGGASNTNGHVVPNVADDTIALLAASQTFTTKTISGASNTITNIGNGSLTNSSIIFANGTGISGGATVALGGTYTPAVDQSTAFAWTAAHTLTVTSVGTAQTAGYTIQNTTAAANGAQQFSPYLAMYGNGWGTTGGTSQQNGWVLQSQPVQGTTPRADLVFYHNVNGSLTKSASITSNSGFIVTENSGNAILNLSNTNGAQLAYGASGTVTIGSASLIVKGPATDGASAIGVQASTQNGFSTSGAAVLKALSGANTGVYLAAFSGDAAQQCALAVDMLADTAGITAGKVVVWSANTGKAADAGATNNLTTIAGVALTSAASTAFARVCVRGKAKVNADAGITVGQLVGTSSGTAGNVQSGTVPGAGAIVGRAIEATGTTTASKVYVDVLVN